MRLRRWLRRRAVPIAIAAGLVLFAAGFALVWDYLRFLERPLALPERGLEFTVAPGSSVGDLARALEARGVLSRPLYFEVYARLEGLAPRLQAGEYLIARGQTPRGLLEQWAEGRVVLHGLTLLEGWTFRQALEAVRAHPKLRQTLAGLPDVEVAARIGIERSNPEGLLFPDTYRFAAGTSDLEVLKRAHRTLQAKLQAAWAARRPGLPFDTPYEALVLASIIEKETGRADERRRIAGVFVRRIKLGMRLQTDPAVIYGLGADYAGELSGAQLRADTPYNTYTRAGLPPTPIALAGAAALAAAVDPAEGEELYFVADGSGGHAFSKTLDEHNRAVREWHQRIKAEE